MTIALFIDGGRTLSETCSILHKLDYLGVCVDCVSMVFQECGLFFNADEDPETTMERIEETGAEIDRRTMSGADSQ